MKVELGQYYTSEAVADYMVSRIEGKPKRILEAGHGEGAFLQALMKAGYREETITAYDVDPNNHEIVRKKFPGVDARLVSYIEAEREEYDLVIGNPPYVKWRNIPADTRKAIEADPLLGDYVNGEWDLLYAFMMLNIDMLKVGGELILIVPYNWFSSTHAAGLREYMDSNGWFSEIIHFNEYKIFADAAPNAIIFRYVKEKPVEKQRIQVIEYLGRRASEQNVIEGIEEQQKILANQKENIDSEWKSFYSLRFPDSSPWFLVSERESKQLKSIEKVASKQLGEVSRIGVGMVTGLDSAFLVDPKDFSKKEQQLIQKFIKAKDCMPYDLQEGTSYIFADHIESETELQEYPRIYEHLLAYKDRLLKRYGAKHDLWWYWATVRNKALFETEGDKIFVPCIDRSLKARYCVGEGYAAGDTLCVVPGKSTDVYYLQAWLNSDVLNYWYRLKGPRTGHRTRYTQAFLETIPYLPPEKLRASDLKKIIESSKKGDAEGINKIFGSVQGLSP